MQNAFTQRKSTSIFGYETVSFAQNIPIFSWEYEEAKVLSNQGPKGLTYRNYSSCASNISRWIHDIRYTEYTILKAKKWNRTWREQSTGNHCPYIECGRPIGDKLHENSSIRSNGRTGQYIENSSQSLKGFLRANSRYPNNVMSTKRSRAYTDSSTKMALCLHEPRKKGMKLTRDRRKSIYHVQRQAAQVE